MKPKNEQTVGAYVALPRKEDGVTGYFCQAEYEEPMDGYWLEIHCPTLPEARAAAKEVLRALHHEGVAVTTMQKHRDLDGRTYWMRGEVETWTPSMAARDSADQRGGQVRMDDEFICFGSSEQEVEERDREAHLAERRRKLQLGLDQIQRGEVFDGEAVFDELDQEHGS
jgi:hypothetical protein